MNLKLFFVTVALVLSASLSACTDGDDKSPVEDDNTTDGDGENTDGDEAQDPSDGDADSPDEEEQAVDRWGFPADHPLLADGLLNIAHRGGGRLAPEESLEAYRNAVAVGADMLEMDLHATSDGVVVLHHDAAVDRITDGTGRIKEMTFEELRILDAGYSFTPDGGTTYPFRGQGVRIATMREVLEEFPSMIFSAEIKQSEPPIVDTVLEILADTGMEDRVILVSFYDEVVQEIRVKNPRIVTGAGAGEMISFGVLTEETWADYAPPCPVFQLSNIDEDLFTWSREMGIKVQIWTVNDAESMRQWIDLGVDGVMTDDPALLESVIQETETARR